MGKELRMSNGEVVDAKANQFTCDGCGKTFDGRPEHTYEGLPFKTYCSDGCVPEAYTE